MLAIVVEGVTALLALAGLAYLVLALWGARSFAHFWRTKRSEGEFAPDVTLLKPVKGVDARMFAGFESHCRQEYAGKFEIVFGVSSLEDAAVGDAHGASLGSGGTVIGANQVKRANRPFGAPFPETAFQ